ncbi:hypothetical protein CW368_09215 [Actinomycetales bacterium SN12]|nr:hypothetical protein CW368_09215 [Actinomycetales bacterium SN12]
MVRAGSHRICDAGPDGHRGGHDLVLRSRRHSMPHPGSLRRNSESLERGQRHSMTDTKMRIGRESVVTFIGISVNAALAFLVTWIIANGLGADATGGFFLLTSLFMIVTSATGLGADTGLVRSLSQSVALDRRSTLAPIVRTAVWPVVLLGFLVSATIWLGAAQLSGWLGLGEDAVPTVRVLAATILPATLTGVLLGGSRGLGRIITYTVVQNLFIPFTRLGAVAVVVYLFHSAWGVIWAWALPLVLACAIAGFALLRQLRVQGGGQFPPTPTERKALTRTFWSFSLPRGGTIILERALDWADVLMVIALLGPAMGGIYGVVTRVVQAGAMLEAALRIVLGPRLSAATAVGNHALAERLFLQVTQFLILASWPFYITIAVFSSDILRLFGEEFVQGSTALIILAVAMGLRNTAGALQTVLLMVGRSTWQLFNKAVQLGVMVLLAAVAVPAWGIIGGAVAFAVSVAVDTLLASVQVHRSLGFITTGRSVARAAVLPVSVVLVGGLLASALLRDASALTRISALVAVVAIYGAALLVVLKRGMFGFDNASE